MKNNHHHWAVPLSGVLFMGAGLSAIAAPDQATYFDSTNRVTLSMRFGLNIQAKFSGIGTAAGSGHYFDGYVLTDSTGNYLGYTSYWGANGPSQYNQPGQPANTFSFHNPVNSSAGSSADNSPYLGLELTYDRQLGVKEDWHHLRYGVEGAVNYMNISVDNHSSYGTAVSTTPYTYGGVPGVLPSSWPYQGAYNGNPNDPTLGVPALPTTTTPGGNLQVQDDFNANLWGGRLGPYVELPFGKQEQFTLALSSGLALGLVDASESWNEALTLPGGGAPIRISGSGNNFDVLWGWYVSGTANYQLNQQWGLAAGVQFQDLGTYSHNFSGRTAQLDLSQSVFFQFGVSYSF